MNHQNVQSIKRYSSAYPANLVTRLAKNAPVVLNAIGPIGLLANHKTALFCSARAPGSVILHAHDTARRLRDEGKTVISGFHSPIENDCLRILLLGKQPIIICLARAISRMRIPSDLRAAFDAKRILFLSPFTERYKRVTRESAFLRNELVATLADDVFIASISPAGHTAKIAQLLNDWKVPVLPSKPHSAYSGSPQKIT